jgi:uncharacterized protein (DUF362 family)
MSIKRREFLQGAAAAGAAGAAPGRAQNPLSSAATDYHPTTPNYRIVTSYKPEGKLGMPGLYPGKVVEMASESCIDERTDRVDRNVLRRMVSRGMSELTGAPDATAAWRVFFQPGDRVAIKVNASGAPQCVSSPELVLEVIAGLSSAGIKPDDIWLYERYAGQMDLVGYEAWVPDGVHVWTGERRRGELAGYDRDVYVEVDFQGEEDRRSYLWEVVSKHVDKIVNIPNVKDHASAGATGCLKNVAYGSFNNVARSHEIRSHITHTRTFIGTLCTVEPLRSRTVLHILDGLRGVWHGGPAAFTPEFFWYPKYLQFGTDPVATDRLLVDTVENKRRQMGAVSLYDRNPKSLGGTRADRKVLIRYREPGHVDYAAGLRLGIADREKIQLRRLRV